MQVVVRALRVLTLIGEQRPEGLSLTEVADALELPPPSTHRLLKVLIAEGFIDRDPATLRHFPGERLLGLVGTPRTTLADLARPHIQSLSRTFDETTFVAELIGSRAVCVAMAESQRPLHLSVRIGHELPLHAAATGRVLLAYQPEDDVRAMLADRELTRFTPGTPDTLDKVMAHLDVIRERGYDLSDNELDKNVWAVSVPVGSEDVIASLTLTAQIDRVGGTRQRRRMIDGVCSTATAIAGELTPSRGRTPRRDTR